MIVVLSGKVRYSILRSSRMDRDRLLWRQVPLDIWTQNGMKVPAAVQFIGTNSSLRPVAEFRKL